MRRALKVSTDKRIPCYVHISSVSITNHFTRPRDAVRHPAELPMSLVPHVLVIDEVLACVLGLFRSK